MKAITYLFLIFSTVLIAQDTSYNAEEISVTEIIDGTLLVPESDTAIPLAILIAGSGPTDRDGNQPVMKNNSFRFLAEDLYKKDIATFRYDKRIVKQIIDRKVKEEDIRFDQFIEDATDVLNYFKEDERFSKIYIIGHSQGSLIGMVVAQKGADGFISVAGAGQTIDAVVIEQLAVQAPGFQENAIQAFSDMRSTGISNDFHPALASIFRKEIQPFMLSWMLYDPAEEITKLDIPVLIIQGEMDLQVKISDAEMLKEAKPDADYILIPKMNHVLKEVGDMNLENQKTYNIPNLPVIPELIDIISDFIKK